MPLQIIRNDITKMDCDAIVNAANSTLLGGGGVDGAIHAAAGPELLEECRNLGGCMPGQAKVTDGYRLAARYVIHTVGPVWYTGQQGEPETLRDCYRNSLEIALSLGCRSIAFPLISAGAYGCPKETALQIAVGAISEFLLREEMLVYLVVYDKVSFQASRKLIAEIEEYIDENYIGEHTRADMETNRYRRAMQERWSFLHRTAPKKEAAPLSQPEDCVEAACGCATLDELMEQVDESFSQMLLRKIDEKGMSDAECYKKANIDRKLFSKIRKDIHYKPSKVTAIAFAISLELSLAETKDLLQKAGFALSRSSKFDIIIEYFISRGIYDIYEINQALFTFDQLLLGG